jgi:antitoxin PrlF
MSKACSMRASRLRSARGLWRGRGCGGDCHTDAKVLPWVTLEDEPMPLANEHVSRVTTKGQVLLHKSVRDQLGIVPGAQVRVGTNARGQAVIEPVDIWPTNPVERATRIRAAITELTGKYRTGISTDEQMRGLRGDPEL